MSVKRLFKIPLNLSIKLALFCVFIYLATILFSTTNAFAAPSISGVSGSLTHGQSVTIQGSGFGTKSPATPLLWDDFSRGTTGQPLSTGTASPWTTQAECVNNYSNSMSYGKSSLSAAQEMRANAPCWTRTTRGVLGNQEQIFLAYHYYAVPGSSGTHTKMARVGSNDDVHNTPNSGYTAFSPDYWYIFGNSHGETAIVRVPAIAGQWVRDDTWSVLGHDNTADGTIGIWRDGKQQAYRTDVVTKNSDSSSSFYNQVFLPYYTESASRTVYVGDIYIDNTLSRVEVCTGSTWSNRGSCEIQIPTAWNSDGINVTVKVNQGAFANSSSKYLYIVDSTGAANSNGHAVTFGTSSSTTFLAAPTNLTITNK